MGAKPFEFHPEAIAEAEAALVWYGQRSERAAQGFFAELEKAIETISKAPRRWPEFEAQCRRYPLARFPYFVVYREDDRLITVIAVAHGRRRPGYWRLRSGV